MAVMDLLILHFEVHSADDPTYTSTGNINVLEQFSPARNHCQSTRRETATSGIIKMEKLWAKQKTPSQYQTLVWTTAEVSTIVK